MRGDFETLVSLSSRIIQERPVRFVRSLVLRYVRNEESGTWPRQKGAQRVLGNAE